MKTSLEKDDRITTLTSEPWRTFVVLEVLLDTVLVRLEDSDPICDVVYFIDRSKIVNEYGSWVVKF